MAKFSKKQRDFLKSVEAGKPANYSFKNDPYGTPEQRKAKACRKTKIVIGLIGLAGMTALRYLDYFKTVKMKSPGATLQRGFSKSR